MTIGLPTPTPSAGLFARGFVTAIRLPLRPGFSADQVEDLLDELIRPEMLVFLPSVRRIELHSLGRERVYESSGGVRVGVGKVVHVDEHRTLAAPDARG